MDNSLDIKVKWNSKGFLVSIDDLSTFLSFEAFGNDLTESDAKATAIEFWNLQFPLDEIE